MRPRISTPETRLPEKRTARVGCYECGVADGVWVAVFEASSVSGAFAGRSLGRPSRLWFVRVLG